MMLKCAILRPRHLAAELDISETKVRHLLRLAYPEHHGQWYLLESEKEEVLRHIGELKPRGITPGVASGFPPDTAMMREVIAHFGSMEKTGRAIDVTAGTIWRSTHWRISEKTAMAIERATDGKFSAAALCCQGTTESDENP